MQFTDKVTITDRRVRQDGYLVVDARIARTGIQLYRGSEVGKPTMDIVRVYRSEAEVFSQDAMASFAHVPVTNDHPSAAVTADTWKQVAVGQTDGEIKRDGDFLRVPMMVADAAAIKQVESGKRELSAGYCCDLDWTGGTTQDGLTYDAAQTNIRANHVAIVQAGRAGKDCRIGDGADHWGLAPLTDALDKEPSMTTRTVLVDGLSVETTDAGAQAIAKLIADRDGLTTRLSQADTAHQTALAAKDTALSTLQAKLDDANAKVLTPDAVSKLVADRVALEATAHAIAKDVKATGLSDSALKVAVVKAVLGDKLPAERVNDQAYIDARFDILAEDAGKVAATDTFRQVQQQRGAPPAQVLGDAKAIRQQAFDALLHFDQTGQELGAN